MARKYLSFYPGEMLVQKGFDNHHYYYPDVGVTLRVLEDGKSNPDYTPAWVRVERVNRRGATTSNPYWTFKRFFQRIHNLKEYKADQLADQMEDLL